jgi:ADP-ribose pyrophosphatase
MSRTKSPLRTIAEGRYITLVEEDGWEYVIRHGVTGIVIIVAVTDDGKLLLVEQTRTAVHNRVIELPAGMVGDEVGRRSEALADAAARELEEETGYRARELVLIGQGPTAVGVSDEVVTFFDAIGLRRVGPGGGDEDEDITVHEVPLPELRAFLATQSAAGLAIDPKIFAGLYLSNFVGPSKGPTPPATSSGGQSPPPLTRVVPVPKL